MKPLLRWVGGNYNQKLISDRINQLYKPYRATHRWVEPFVGGMGLTHRVEPNYALLNDSNIYLMLFYRSLMNKTFDFNFDKKLLGADYDTLRNYLNEEIQYYDKYQIIKSDEKYFCQLFFLINRKNFNGIWHLNSKGIYNVPIGKTSSGEPLSINKLPDLNQYYEFMQNKELHCSEWNHLPIQDNAFIVCDPPYDDGFSSYTENNFYWQDQVSLAIKMARLNKPVILLNKSTPRILDLYSEFGYTIEIVSANRSVSSDGNRDKVNEVIAHKNVVR